MAESPVAPAPVQEKAPSITRSAPTPEGPAPELASEAAAQAVVRAFHPGAGGSGAAGGSAGPPANPTWTPRTTRVAPRDLVALQRMAGNKAVSRLVGHRPQATATAQAASVQRDTTPPPQTLPTTGSGSEPANQGDPGNAGGGGNAYGQSMVVRSDSSAKAAADLAKWARTLVNNRTKAPLQFVVITLDPKSVDVWDRDGGHIKGPFELALPKGTYFDEGVFVTMPGSGQSMRMRLDPKEHRFRPYEDAAILQEIDQKKAKAAKGGAGSPGDVTDAAPDTATAGPADAQAGGPMLQPTSKGPKGFDLRKYIKNPAGLDELAATYGSAVEFLVVRTPLDGGGGTGKGGGKPTTGFAGELEGHGSPPNRPGWPVTMEGPKMLPIGGTGNYSATVNWAANGSDQLSMVASQIGTSIHYKWEVFNITAQAKAEAERQARKAREAKAAIQAMMGKGLMPDAADGQTQTAVRSDVAGKGGAKGGGTQAAPATKDPTAPPPGPTDENETTYADDLQKRKESVAGSGQDVTGLGGANVEFQREFKNLWGDTKRSWNQVGNSAGGGFFERRSDDLANITAVGLLPISALVTSLGASMRWSSEFFAGERQQQEIPMKQGGTYLIRVIASPRADTDRDGKPIIRPSTVATQVVEVVEMDRMVREGLNDPGAREAEAKKAYQDALDAKAKGKATDKEVESAKAKFENVSLDVSGDPRILLQTRIHDKERELEAVKDKWEKYSIRGPIIEVQDQLEILRKRLELYDKQDTERRQGAGNETRLLAPGMRITATLASEVTGQPYPLLLSVGPMKADAGTYKWMVLDGTSKKAEEFVGESTVSDRDAIDKALKKFGGDAQYGRGTIGVRLSPDVMKQLKPGDNPEFRIESQAVGWAIARTRIDDLVMTLVALGLMVASAGTAAAIIGAAVAAAKLIHRLFAGTLELDVETISDLLAVLGGAGALMGASAKASQVAAGIRVKKIGELFVMLPESAAVESNLAKATAAFNKAVSLAHKVEMANEALGYAGLVWGNATFLMGMADISIAESDGKITHAEARRQRATAIGGAIQNNGLFLAGNVKKARDAKAAAAKAAAGTKGGPTETSVGAGGSGGTGGSDSTTTAATDPTAGTTGTEGGKHDVPTPKPTSPTETGTHNEQPGPKDAAPGNKPSVEDSPTKGGGAKDEAAAKAVDTAVVEDPVKAGTEKAAEQGTTEAPKPAPELPAPGSSKGRKAAKQIIDGVATGGEPHGSVEDAIKLAGDWKSTLKKALSKFTGDERRAAEDALVKARDKIVEDTWKKVQEANKPRFDKLRLENAGTKSFGSDIDATVRPLEGTEAGGSGADMAEQIKNAGEAAKEMSKALRDRVGGETDVVIDTNIYSFIGEGRIKPTDPKARGAQQHVDVLVGLAEQMRGQSEKQFNEFVGRLKNRLKDPRFQTEMDALIGEAKEFHKDRVKEFSEAVDRAKANKDNKGDAAQKRAAREELLQTKKNELADLMNTDKPDVGKITRKQAEINWYAPDAYATPSAFKQAVAHGQRLKGSARASAEWTPKEVATKLREAAGRLKPDDPQAAKLKADADLVDSQSRLLESTLREHKALVAESPMNAERVNQLERRAAQLREAIADRANKVMIAEIMGETAPSDRPSGERLSESAAASGANMGMLEDHMAHAPDLDGMVKAAAKYAGRIAMAEFLSGLRPSGEPISRLIAEFVKGRWGIMEDASPQIMRDMFVRYARLTGRHTELAYNSRGEAIGATDALKQAFAHDVRSWARQTNENIQVAAMESKTFDNPTPAMPTPAPDGTGGGSGGGAGAPGPDAGGGAGGGGIKGPPAGGGGGSEPPPSSGSGPASSSDRPTIPAPAPEDNGPATVKNPKPAPDDNGPATKKVGAGEGPAGGVVVDPPDGIATVVRAKNHPQDLVRLEVIGNQIRLTDIYRTTQTEVSGSTLLTAALKEVGAVAGNELYIHNIVNPETVSAYKDGIHAELSKLGRTAARGLEGAGLAAGPMRWHHDGEKLFISIEIK